MLRKSHPMCKFFVLAWSIDCESGNRKMANLVAEEKIQFLEYLFVFPDVVHLAKTYKCSWGNWFLIQRRRKEEERKQKHT